MDIAKFIVGNSQALGLASCVLIAIIGAFGFMYYRIKTIAASFMACKHDSKEEAVRREDKIHEKFEKISEDITSIKENIAYSFGKIDNNMEKLVSAYGANNDNKKD